MSLRIAGKSKEHGVHVDLTHASDRTVCTHADEAVNSEVGFTDPKHRTEDLTTWVRDDFGAARTAWDHAPRPLPPITAKHVISVALEEPLTGGDEGGAFTAPYDRSRGLNATATMIVFPRCGLGFGIGMEGRGSYAIIDSPASPVPPDFLPG